LERYASRFAYLDNHLRHRDFLLERFSVADAYLYTVLNWTVPTRVELTSWPAIRDYRERLQTRPSISRAVREEYALYEAELARHQAA
jgi:glutathione S-transferase